MHNTSITPCPPTFVVLVSFPSTLWEYGTPISTRTKWQNIKIPRHVASSRPPVFRSSIASGTTSSTVLQSIHTCFSGNGPVSAVPHPANKTSSGSRLGTSPDSPALSCTRARMAIADTRLLIPHCIENSCRCRLKPRPGTSSWPPKADLGLFSSVSLTSSYKAPLKPTDSPSFPGHCQSRNNPAGRRDVDPPPRLHVYWYSCAGSIPRRLRAHRRRQGCFRVTYGGPYIWQQRIWMQSSLLMTHS